MDQWQHQLAAAKRDSQATVSDDDIQQPKWFSNIPQAHKITAEFNHLLDQLPIIQNLTDPRVKEQHFNQIVAELVKIYYYRARIIQLSFTISDSDKPTQIQALFNECKQVIADITYYVQH
jgi:hypothetical protein